MAPQVEPWPALFGAVVGRIGVAIGDLVPPESMTPQRQWEPGGAMAPLKKIWPFSGI